ncbi:MAG: TIM barrel protein [Nanoarchaeota archaeon]
MVEFGTKYNMPLDREYGSTSIAHDPGRTSPNSNSTNDVGVGIRDIGFSLGLGPTPNVPAIGAKLRAGSKTAELTFMGAGKGSGQHHTPEYYGKAQRKALEEMGKANEVNFTTHASVGIQGLAGMDQQGNFSKAGKDFSVQEIKRAIEFAGDVAQGGPVVVHTGEFHRPIAGADWNKDGKDAGKFEMYEGEQERASFRVVDTRTGAVIQEARKNRKISRPIWKVAAAGQEYTDFEGQKRIAQSGERVYVDYFGKRLKPEDRVPEFDEKKREFKVTQMDWNDLINEAKEMTGRAQEEFRRWDNLTEEQKRKSIWRERILLAKEAGKNVDKLEIRPEEAYIIATLETNAGNSRGWAHYYGGDFDETIDHIKRLKKAKEFYQKMETAVSEEEKWKLKQQAGALAGGLAPLDTKYPTQIIEQHLRELERKLRYSKESASSSWSQAEEANETIRHVQSAETYALQESYDAYAQAGISAMRQSDKMEQLKKLKKPIAVAMENLFPESYGSHPDELKDLVLSSRERMAKTLEKKYGYSSEKARKEADEHLTATLDTGHVNMWRKYWKSDNKKTIEENDKDFNGWLINKIGDLAKANVIGHVHLVDNYGYQDDHLAPGEGNSPIAEMITSLKKNGYKGELIVEPGADWSTDVTGFHSVMKTWKFFGSPVYGAGGGAGISSRGWSSVGNGYFGHNQPPYFMFPPYTPSEDWTLWTGVPLD